MLGSLFTKSYFHYWQFGYRIDLTLRWLLSQKNSACAWLMVTVAGVKKSNQWINISNGYRWRCLLSDVRPSSPVADDIAIFSRPLGQHVPNVIFEMRYFAFIGDVHCSPTLSAHAVLWFFSPRDAWHVSAVCRPWSVRPTVRHTRDLCQQSKLVFEGKHAPSA